MSRTFLKALCAVALFAAPSFAFAATAAIGALNPPDGKAGVGAKITFSMVISGFTNPTYYLTDSFPGGATTVNIDSGGNFSWTPNNNDIGTHVITVLVTDSQGNSASVSYSFQVVAPTVSTASSPAASVQYGSAISFALNYSGFINPTITVEDDFFNSSVSSNNLVGNVFSWTPQKKDVGVHNLRIEAKDAQGRSHSMSQKIAVLGVPSVSVLNLLPGTTVGAGEKLTFSPYTSELQSPQINVKDLFSNSTPTPITWDATLGQYVWYPVYNDVGVHQFIITATESSTGRSASAEMRVTVVPSSVKPLATTTPAAASSTPPKLTPPPPSSSSASSYVFKTYLAQGSSGVAVTELQKKLISLGFLKSEPTGYFGALTKKAVQDFQKAKGLEQVGFVGPGTRAALNK
jgi:hypothetical protein